MSERTWYNDNDVTYNFFHMYLESLSRGEKEPIYASVEKKTKSSPQCSDKDGDSPKVIFKTNEYSLKLGIDQVDDSVKNLMVRTQYF